MTQIAATVDGVYPAYDAGDSLRVRDVLFYENARGEALSGVCVRHLDGALQDDGAVIELLVDEVHRAAGELGAVRQRLRLGVEPWKGWQQRWMDVQDAMRECGNEAGAEQAHVAGKTDEVDTMLAKSRDHLRIMLGAFAAGGRYSEGRQAAVARRVETWSVLAIGEHDGDLNARQMVVINRIGDGDEV